MEWYLRILGSFPAHRNKDIGVGAGGGGETGRGGERGGRAGSKEDVVYYLII